MATRLSGQAGVASDVDKAVDDRVHALTLKWFGSARASVPRLFHYTDEIGMASILERGRIWAGDIRFMNDYKEVEHAFELLATCLDAQLEGDQDIRALVMSDLRAEEIVSTRGAFIACFSEEDDALSQWRAYANDGRGYAIEVDVGRVPSHIELGMPGPPSLFGPWVGKCIYDRDIKRQIVEAMVGMLHELVDELGINHFPLIRAALLRVLSFCVLTFKHHAFAEEKEWRLIWLGSFDELTRTSGVDVVKFRSTRYGFAPYLDWPLSVADPWCPWRVLRSVTCGPKVDAESTRISLERYFNWLCYPPGSVAIHRSAASYR